MSRARQGSHVHVVADSTDQAVDDLVRDWSSERRQTWGIDTGRPDTEPGGPLTVEADPAAPAALRATLGRGRLKAERDALVATLRAEPPTEPQAALRHLKDLDGLISRLNRRLEPQLPGHRAPGRGEDVGSPSPAADRSVGPALSQAVERAERLRNPKGGGLATLRGVAFPCSDRHVHVDGQFLYRLGHPLVDRSRYRDSSAVR